MEKNLMIAGFGGQGVMMMGKLLSLAVCDNTDKEVTFFPSYGAQQRGGTANCFVVMSDEPVGSPKPAKVEELIVMNDPSFRKFSPNLKSEGVLFTNSSIVTSEIERDDITVVEVPVTEMAMELGNLKVLNIIMLGAYIGYTQAVDDQIILDTVLKVLAKKPKLLPLNEKAFKKGLEQGKKNRIKATA